MMDDSTLSNLFYHLDMAVMERLNDGSLQLIGDLPDCLKRFFPDVSPCMKRFRPEEEFPFLENFLFDAEDWWNTESSGRLKSGPWIETDQWGNECEFEATALCIEKRDILLIELARYSYEEKQAFIQKSRELSLAYHRLAQAEAEVKKARDAAEDANRKIISSIRYSRMIQRSLLPDPENIRTFLQNSFYIWMPRDIVGGDFIFAEWLSELSRESNATGTLVIAVVDCTGHGVPGALMTIIACFALRKIIRDEKKRAPAQILARLNFLVKTSLHQDTDYALSDDGLDAAVCCIEVQGEGQEVRGEGSRMIFAGAKLPLIYIENDKVETIKGDKQSLGYRRSDLDFEYTNHFITIQKGMRFYMFTDGFTDQHGGKKKRRFGSRRFRELLKKNAHLSFDKQREALLQAFDDYRGSNERRDDMTGIGFGF